MKSEDEGEWIQLDTGGTIPTYVYIGRSEELPELEDLLHPPQ